MLETIVGWNLDILDMEYRVRKDAEGENIIMLDIDLLLQKKTLPEIRNIVETQRVFSVPGLTFMGSLSDSEGKDEEHPWMGYDRYETAVEMLQSASDDFDVTDCFEILKSVAQTVCPTVVSMVYDVTNRVVYWCEHQDWVKIQSLKFE